MGGLLWSEWRSVLELFQVLFDIYRHVDIYWDHLVVPVNFNFTGESTCLVLNHLIFSWRSLMMCCSSSFLLYFITNSSTTNINLMPFVLYLHRPGVIGSGA